MHNLWNNSSLGNIYIYAFFWLNKRELGIIFPFQSDFDFL